MYFSITKLYWKWHAINHNTRPILVIHKHSLFPPLSIPRTADPIRLLTERARIPGSAEKGQSGLKAVRAGSFSRLQWISQAHKTHIDKHFTSELHRFSLTKIKIKITVKIKIKTKQTIECDRWIADRWSLNSTAQIAQQQRQQQEQEQQHRHNRWRTLSKALGKNREMQKFAWTETAITINVIHKCSGMHPPPSPPLFSSPSPLSDRRQPPLGPFCLCG